MIDPETGIWSLAEAKQSHFFDEPLATCIIGVVSPFPFATLDMGCGRGSYCAFFRKCGWGIVTGWEGTPGIRNIADYDNVYETDLLDPPFHVPPYDFVMCLEVGEHVPAKHEQTLLDNIAHFAKDKLLLSWAVPGQAGVGHVNCRTNDYIIEQMTKRGFEFDIDTTLKLRIASTLPWFASTLMWFDRRVNG